MILVTGATGHIGNVLIRELLARGETVRALVLPGEDRTPLAGLPVEIVEGDVLEPASLKNAMRAVRWVYHLAGMISILPGRDPLLRRVNVEGTANVLRAARAAGVRRLVYTSSIHAIARPTTPGTIDENVPFDPATAIGEYDRSKAEASLTVLKAVEEGLDAVIVLPTGVIGPHDYRLSEMGRVILDAMEAPVLLAVDGAFDFVDVRDVAQGEILACEAGKAGESYILSGERIEVHRILETVREFVGSARPILCFPRAVARFAASFTPLYYRLTGKRPRLTPYSIETVGGNSTISHAKATRHLGYRPRSLRETIGDTVRWFSDFRRPLAVQPVPERTRARGH
jgi:dihydroflavonol-4-reductase